MPAPSEYDGLMFAGLARPSTVGATDRMRRNMYAVIAVIVMIAIIVAVDLLFFRHHIWERLMVNVGIVLVFLAFYLRLFRKI